MSVTIVFVDGDILTISDVMEYGHHKEPMVYYVMKNTGRMFFNADYVKYIGQTDQL